MNVQGLMRWKTVDARKVAEIVKLADRENLELVAVQETWFWGDEQNELVNSGLKGSGWTWHGRARRDQKRAAIRGSGGVGLFCKADAGWQAQGGKCDGLIVAEKGEWRVACVYFVPANSTRLEHNASLEEKLTEVVHGWAGKNIMVLGDGNGRFGNMASSILMEAGGGGREDMVDEIRFDRSNRDHKRNAQGEWLVKLMDSLQLVVVNGLNDRPMEHTHVGGRGHSVVDFVAVSSGLVSKESGVAVVEDSDVSVGSDHRLIIASDPAWKFKQAKWSLKSAVEMEAEKWPRRQGD